MSNHGLNHVKVMCQCLDALRHERIVVFMDTHFASRSMEDYEDAYLEKDMVHLHVYFHLAEYTRVSKQLTIIGLHSDNAVALQHGCPGHMQASPSTLDIVVGTVHFPSSSNE